jgi:hypothetical protein
MDFGIVDVICARNVRLCVSAFEKCWWENDLSGGENVFRRAAKLQKPRAIAQHVRIQGNAMEFVVCGGESFTELSLLIAKSNGISRSRFSSRLNEHLSAVSLALVA